MTRRVYIDSCVLVHALKSKSELIAIRAISEISKSDVEYIFSPLLELELIPKAWIHYREQAEFYAEWLEHATRVPYDSDVHKASMEQAKNYDIQGFDAVHVGTAIIADADELVTTEGPTKPMCTTRELRVRSILRDDE